MIYSSFLAISRKNDKELKKIVKAWSELFREDLSDDKLFLKMSHLKKLVC